MRKFGAISFVTFYLTLTSGLFVCLIHCSAEYLFTNPKRELVRQGRYNGNDCNSDNKGKHRQPHQACGEGKDCSCCKQHDTYLVKENVIVKAFQLCASEFSISSSFYQLNTLIWVDSEKDINWHQATGPPVFLKGRLFISNNSLLI